MTSDAAEGRKPQIPLSPRHPACYTFFNDTNPGTEHANPKHQTHTNPCK